MKAVVLCGGRGERLMPMTDRRPAALLRLCGKEILLFTLEMLEKAGCDVTLLAIEGADHADLHFFQKEIWEEIGDFFQKSLGDAR